jgi:hypothetical protein
LDVYLVLDLSHSMVYDTERPDWWDDDETREYVCPQTGCPDAYCQLPSNRSYCEPPDHRDDVLAEESWCQCRAYYCNYEGQLERPDLTTFDKVADCDPLDAHIKDSAMYFLSELDSRYDRVGVVSYDTQGSLAVPLSDEFETVSTTIRALNAYLHPTYLPGCVADDPECMKHLSTNIGDGLMVANANMSLPPPGSGGEGGRLDSIWSAILLTDGRANRYRACPSAGCDCSNCPPACETCPVQYCDDWSETLECDDANLWATDNAWVSWDPHRITVYTIAYGDIFFDHTEYRQLMTEIADITDNGEVDGTTNNFWAVPDEAGLQQALEEIADRIYTRLLR